MNSKEENFCLDFVQEFGLNNKNFDIKNYTQIYVEAIVIWASEKVKINLYTYSTTVPIIQKVTLPCTNVPNHKRAHANDEPYYNTH